MVKSRRSRSTIIGVGRALLTFIVFLFFSLLPPIPVTAEDTPILTIVPITWNVMGLDSNNVLVGPHIFPVGARVCNVGQASASNVTSTFVWDTNDSYIKLSDSSMTEYTDENALESLGSGECHDFYYEVEIVRDSAAYEHTREYYITANADSLTEITTTQPREIFVEHLISQNRNSTNEVKLGTDTIVPGGSMALEIGKTYTITLKASTATQGYNQLEDFINFPSKYFEILDIQTTYTANTSTYVANANDKIYADACLWDNNPDSITYLSCVGSDGKAGGSITNVYTVKVIGGAGTTQSLNTLIYDFSGSSFHYNSDFSSSVRFALISSPLTLSKAFSPSLLTSAGTPSTLSLSIKNNSASTISGIELTDTFPTLPAQMSVAGTPNYNTSSDCVPNPAFIAHGGDTSITYQGGIVGNGTCVISVDVTIPTDGTYLNTTDTLLISGGDTGITASSSLIRSTSNPGTSCSTLEMAYWNLNSATVTRYQNSIISSAPTASPGSIGTYSFTTPTIQSPGSGGSAWEATGFLKNNFNISNTAYYQFAIDTTKFTKVKLTFNALRTANGPTAAYVYYGTSATPSSETQKTFTPNTISDTAWNTYTLDFTGQTTGTMYFTIYGFPVGNAGADARMELDDVTFNGEYCTTYQAPTLSKTFSPDTIMAGSTSALSFVITNNDSTNAISNVSFTDVLPAGMKVTTQNPSSEVTSSTTCSSASFNPAKGDTTLNFSGASMTAGQTCTATVYVTVDKAGTYYNTTGNISSSQTGINTTNGTDDATLAANLLPPVIEKAFSPNPTYINGTSVLTFTLSNPNISTDLTGVAFSDTLPKTLTAGSWNSTCEDGIVNISGDHKTISLIGATLPAGGACAVTVDTSSADVDTYPNTSGYVSADSVGNGNQASDTLVLNPVTPQITILKQISSSASGPWASKINVGSGEKVYYRFTIENTGDVALSPVWVTDSDAGINVASCSWPASLPVGSATADPTASCVVGPVDITSGTHDNFATAHGTYQNVVYDSTQSKATYATTALTIDKKSSTTTYSVIGEPISYIYTVTNIGAASLPDPVKVFDTNTSVSCPNVNTVGDHDSNLDQNESVDCTGSYLVTDTDMSTGSVTNAAFATAGSATSNTDRLVVYEDLPDLVVTKTNDTPNGYATNGESFLWTIEVTNVGPVAAQFSDTWKILSDTLPTGPTYGTLSQDTSELPGNSILCDYGVTLANTITCTADGAVTIGSGKSFSVSIPVTPNSLSTLTNIASVDSDKKVDEGNDGNNNGTDSVSISEPLPDLKMTKTNSTSDDTVAIHSPFTWTMTVTNLSGSAATFSAGQKVISDTLPSGANFGTPTKNLSEITGEMTCTINGTTSKTLDCTADNTVMINVGQSFSVSVATTPTVAGEITNTATVDPDHHLADADTGNNTDSNGLTVESPDLTVTKDNDTSDEGMQGTAFNWTITTRNVGPVAATFSSGQNILRDELPGGVNYPSSTSISSPSGITGSILCTIDDENIGGTPTKVLNCLTGETGASIGASGGGFSVVLNVTPTASGTLVNHATVDVYGVLSESDETNNTGTDTLNILSNAPAILVDKTSSTSYIYFEGQVIDYTFTVSNGGNRDLNSVVIHDANCDGGLDPAYSSGDDGDGVLELSENWVYTCSHTVTSGEFNAGTDLSNTVTVDSAETDPATDTLSLHIALISVEKSASVQAVTSAGQTILYTFTLQNKGTQPLSNVTVGDPMCDSFAEYGSGDTSEVGVLNLTETWIYTCTHTVTTTEFTSGTALSNTVTVDSDESAAVTDTLELPVARIAVEKSTTTTLITQKDQVVPYTFTVTNSGSNALSEISVSDALCDELPAYVSGDTTNLGKLDVSETWIYQCNHTVTSTEMTTGAELTNTVTVDSKESTAVTDNYSIPVASLVVEKTSTTSSVTAVNQAVPYQFAVQNKGSVNLGNIDVSDAKCSGEISGPEGDSNSDGILQNTETWIYRCSHTVNQTEINAGGVLSNTVTVTSDKSQSASDTLEIPITQSPAIQVDKTSTTTYVNASGQVVPYQFRVSNVGNIPLSTITLADPKCDAAPVLQSGDTNTDGLLQLSEVWIYTCSHTVSETEINDLSVLSNTATVDSEESEADTSTLNIPINKTPAIGVAKQLVGEPSKVSGKAGVWSVTFEILVKNYGNVPLNNVQMVDELSETYKDASVVDPPTSFEVKSLSSSSLAVNWPGFTGKDALTSDLLKGTDTLAVGGEGKVTLTLELTPASEGPFDNFVTATAEVSGGDPVTDQSTEGSDPDPDHDGDPTNNSQKTGTTFSANIFDPPHGTKVFDDSGLPYLIWTMEWINDTNITAVAAEIHDPISAGTSYLKTGSPSGYGVPSGAPDKSTDVGISCTDSSLVTNTVECYYEGPSGSYPRGRIIWKGTIGPDLGVSDPAVAVNDLKIEFHVTVDSGVTGVENVATIDADLNGDGDTNDTSEISAVSAASTWGTLGGASPIPTATPMVNKKLPGTGFPPEVVTFVREQPASLAYSTTEGLTLEIPKLNLAAPILGVPLNSATGEWDVTWLSDQVGWLNGTAFPTVPGNSVITGHVYLASGEPGPFMDLGTLKWGDDIYIHNQGKVFVYEVREVKSVLPESQAAFVSERKSWITLVTCQGYDENTGRYARRKLVRAVLLEVYRESR